MLCCEPAPFLTVALPPRLTLTSRPLQARQVLCEQSRAPSLPTAAASALAFTSLPAGLRGPSFCPAQASKRRVNPHNSSSYSFPASTAQSTPPRPQRLLWLGLRLDAHLQTSPGCRLHLPRPCSKKCWWMRKGSMGQECSEM